MYRVMIADDEPIIVEGLSRSIAWEKWNCQVVATANDGLEGKRLVEEKRPDIIFLDICMPEMDGLSMIAALSCEFPDLEVSVLTGFRDFEYAQQAIRLGVTRFLLKPSNMGELEEAISTMCENLKKKGITGELPTNRAENEYVYGKTNRTENCAGSEEVNRKEKGEESKDSGEKNEHDSVCSSFIVKNALCFIEENHTRKLTLSEVAEKTYVSQWHLSKLLNRHTGQSFSDILNRVRIDHAKELLKNPALRIGDISEQVGFLDLEHFSRVFKKQEGVSANEYRNQVLGK
ncbi:MAG: response regulator [Roseburia sp.]|nr:response regulator [Roseburia sp.]